MVSRLVLAATAMGFIAAGCRSSSGAARSGSPLAALAQTIAGRPSSEAVVAVVTAVAEWQLANPSSHKLWEWHQAPFWASLAVFAPLAKDPQRYLGAIRQMGEANGWDPGPRRFHADDHAITQSYFLLHEKQKDPRLVKKALALFDEMLTMPFDEPLDFEAEKTAREWIWCDALFMSPPALALAARATGDRRYADLMNRLWWKTTDYLYDPQEHLYYRDSRFFDQREANGAKVFWSRGNGWVLAGLARVLQYLPQEYPTRPRFVALFREMAQRVGELQRPDGYWRVSLLNPDTIQAPETSGTGFFTYALAFGVNEGLLDRATFEPVVLRGWAALNRAVRSDGKLGYVQRVGAAPGDTGPDETEIYGVGAFVLAGTEIHRLIQTK